MSEQTGPTNPSANPSANPQELVERFYKAFDQHDAETMIACYHSELSFADPVFGSLNYAETSDMWRMLCKRGKDLRVELLGSDVNETGGTADWKATYTCTATGRKVINIVRSQLKFRDGTIVEQRDSFDLWRWSRQASEGCRRSPRP